MQRIQREAVHRADVHFGEAVDVAELVLDEGGHPFLQLRGRPLGEREGHDVSRLGARAQDLDDPL